MSIFAPVKRTISLKLKFFEEDYQALCEMQRTFSQSCSRISQLSEERNRVKLHHQAYYRIRKEIPQIGSQMICNAIAKVSACRKALKKGKELVFKETGSVHYDK
nr:hypothetical protein [Chlamydiota bacterium]